MRSLACTRTVKYLAQNWLKGKAHVPYLEQNWLQGKCTVPCKKLTEKHMEGKLYKNDLEACERDMTDWKTCVLYSVQYIAQNDLPVSR